MQPHNSHCRSSGYTRTDLLFALFALMILVGAGLPMLGGSPQRDKRLVCANNLRIVGQALQGFVIDHGNAFPWRVDRLDGGAGGYGTASQQWRCLSNHLASSRLLACPAGPRQPGESFGTLTDLQVSYFIGSDSEPRQPATIVAGDWDIERGTSASCNFVRATVQSFDGGFGLPRSYAATWSATNHQDRGNVLTADGSVHLTDSAGLRTLLSRSTDSGNNSHILLP